MAKQRVQAEKSSERLWGHNMLLLTNIVLGATQAPLLILCSGINIFSGVGAPAVPGIEPRPPKCKPCLHLYLSWFWLRALQTRLSIITDYNPI